MEYEAHAFHKDLDKGRSSGQLKITNIGLVFSCSEKQVQIPLSGVEFSLGGASHRLVFVSHPHHPDWSIYTSDLGILDNGILKQDENIQSQLQKMKGHRAFNWSLLAVVLLLIVAIPIGFFLSMDAITALIAGTVPVEWEEQLGKRTLAQYRVENELIESEEATGQLAKLTAALTDHVDTEEYEFNIYIANDPSINAFALPGGYIVLHSGLILKADSAREMLGVLAHEMSHVTRQHGLRNIIATASVWLIVQAIIGDVSGLLETIASAAPLLLSQKYSRDFESEADREGYNMLMDANINPQGMVEFFNKVIEEEKKAREKLAEASEETARILETTLEFLSTHPATEERINRIEDLIGDGSRDYKNLDAEFLHLQEMVRAFVAETENSESENGSQAVQ